MSGTMKQVVLRSYPAGNPRLEDFGVETVAVPAPADGEVLLKTLFLSLDPLIRFTIDEKPLTSPYHTQIGEVMYGGTVSRVVASRNAGYSEGEIVEGRTGWREYAAIDPAKVRLRKVDASLGPVSTALGALGMPGQTAHACMIEIGRVKAGETAVISAAGGGVGSLAGQIGKILGARVVGIAGGAAKCAAVEALGFDACVDYKAADFPQRLADACPEGVSLYVDNVGGAVSRAVFPLFKRGARMPVCGYISYYGYGMEGPGPDHMPGFMRTIMSKGLEVRGFGGLLDAGPSWLSDIAGWVREGKLRCPETIVEGIEAAPAAFVSVFASSAPAGKLLVRVGEG